MTTALRPLLSVVLLLLVLSSSAFAEVRSDGRQLVFAADLIRHGDRSPVDAIPADSYVWKQGLGQLTAEGMQQEYDLGCQMRKRYIEDEHLLPSSYEQSTVYVRSSDVDRTLMSAQCLLMGLYPPGSGPALQASPHKPALPDGFQPIPIHTRPRREDSTLIPDSNTAAAELVQKLVYESPSWKQRTDELKPKFQRWSKLSGIQISNLTQLSSLGNALFIYQLHHVPLPAGFTQTDVDEIVSAGEWAYVQIFKPAEIGRSLGRELLSFVLKNFDNLEKPDKKRPRFLLLSAHDSTVSGVMSALGSPVAERPRYASDLNFSFYKEGGELKVVIKLNGKPVDFTGAKDGSCSLAEFKKLVSSL